MNSYKPAAISYFMPILPYSTICHCSYHHGILAFKDRGENKNGGRKNVEQVQGEKIRRSCVSLCVSQFASSGEIKLPYCSRWKMNDSGSDPLMKQITKCVGIYKNSFFSPCTYFTFFLPK